MQTRTIIGLAACVGVLGGVLGGGVVGAVIVSGHAAGAVARIERTLGIPQPVLSGVNTPAPLASTDDQTIAAVDAVSPAVVSIIISKKTTTAANQQRSPLEYFFENVDPFGGVPVPRDPKGTTSSTPSSDVPQEVGGGTGFIVSADGLIVTNRHVVEDADAEYTVLFADGTHVPATIVDTDAFADVGVLRVNKQHLPTVQFGDSSALHIGQTVIAIGNALSEFRNTVTKGVVSGINRRVTAGDDFGSSEIIEEAIQTDAAINFGNSGGPLIDVSGRVIGMNTAVSRPGEGIGFAIPAHVVEKIVRSVVAHGKIIRPRLGVQYVLITPALAAEKGMSVDQGALLVRGETVTDLAVVPGSPADKAGLVENDIILSVDGVAVSTERSLGGLIAKHEPGDTLQVRVLHKGVEKEVAVTLDAWEEKK